MGTFDCHPRCSSAWRCRRTSGGKDGTYEIKIRHHARVGKSDSMRVNGRVGGTMEGVMHAPFGAKLSGPGARAKSERNERLGSIDGIGGGSDDEHDAVGGVEVEQSGGQGGAG